MSALRKMSLALALALALTLTLAWNKVICDLGFIWICTHSPARSLGHSFVWCIAGPNWDVTVLFASEVKHQIKVQRKTIWYWPSVQHHTTQSPTQSINKHENTFHLNEWMNAFVCHFDCLFPCQTISHSNRHAWRLTSAHKTRNTNSLRQRVNIFVRLPCISLSLSRLLFFN